MLDLLTGREYVKDEDSESRRSDEMLRQLSSRLNNLALRSEGKKPLPMSDYK